MIGNTVCITIPYKNFKEKIRITKMYEKCKVEIYKDFILVIGALADDRYSQDEKATDRRKN